MKIKLPLFVRTAKSIKGKKYRINLNYYRNWHFQQSNTIKKKFCENLEPELKGLKLKTPIKINFVLYKGSKRKIDRANILSIMEKFFCDALVNYECIGDDSDSFIEETNYRTGGIDRYDPRCEIEIIENYKI